MKLNEISEIPDRSAIDAWINRYIYRDPDEKPRDEMSASMVAKAVKWNRKSSRFELNRPLKDINLDFNVTYDDPGFVITGIKEANVLCKDNFRKVNLKWIEGCQALHIQRPGKMTAQQIKDKISHLNLEHLYIYCRSVIADCIEIFTMSCRVDVTIAKTQGYGIQLLLSKQENSDKIKIADNNYSAVAEVNDIFELQDWLVNNNFGAWA